MIEISKSRPKSMDDVVDVLKRLHNYLGENGYTCIRFDPVLFAPRARDKKIIPCIPVDEIRNMAKQVNYSHFTFPNIIALNLPFPIARASSQILAGFVYLSFILFCVEFRFIIILSP